MTPEDIPLLIALLLLILCSGYFSAAEMAFSVINTIRLKTLAAAGNKRAIAVLATLDKYDKLLSTVLIGNNVVNIAATTIATVLCVRLWNDAGATISTVAMTLIVLTFGEITPKTLAKRSPEKFAMSIVYTMKFLMWVFTPLSFLFGKWQGLIGSRKNEEPRYTEAELLTIVEESKREGELDAGESELIKSAIEFNEVTAADILTPRVAVEGVEENDSLDEVKNTFFSSGYSRLPVYHKTIDSIVGVVTQKDFFANENADKLPVTQIMKPVSFVTEQMPISKLLKLLQCSKTHLAVVSDEYGGTLGIVTMEDILEELVGEIYDEHDDIDVEIEKVSDGECRVSGSADPADLMEMFGIDCGDEFATVNGWVAGELNKIPDIGDSFEAFGYTITVTDADERKVNEVLIKKLPTEDEKSQKERQDGEEEQE